MSIKTKLIVAFLAIAIIPLLFATILSFNNTRDALKRLRIAELENIADLKVDKIVEFFGDLEEDIEIAQEYYNIKINFSLMSKFAQERTNPEYIAAKKILDKQLKTLQKVKKFFDIMLVNPDGKIVYVTNEAHKVKDLDNPMPDPDGRAFNEGKKGIYFTEIFRNPAEDNKFSMLITAPVRGLDGEFIGIIAFEVDMSPIYNFIQDVKGLGKTGETLIGKRKGKEILLLNPLRHDPEAALKRSINIGSRKGIPVQEAAQGKDGSGLTIDYRGEKVIGAWRYIPSLDWGLVAKIDASEAFAPIAALRHLLMIILVIVLVSVGSTALFIAESISSPIRKLTKAADKISKGETDVKLDIKAKDEIGALAKSFERMLTAIKIFKEDKEDKG